jgi:ligand-binding SRPBCC domain-containing protein
MLLPFKLGAGGPVGSGTQWWPWIHIEDAIDFYLFALDRVDVRGPMNAVSPDIATNARFSQALAYALRRPALAVAPAFGLRAVLGEFADSLLASQLLLPAKAEDWGFVWRHESLDQALLDLLGAPARAPGTTHYESAETIASSPLEVFKFFSDPANLKVLTPPSLELKIKTPLPIAMRRATVLEYEIKVRGLAVRWKSLVTRWREGYSFTDVQVRGPYLLWRHRHAFDAVAGGVAVRDEIDYALPLAPLSNVALSLVREDVRQIFNYRRTKLDTLLKGKSAP